MNIRPSVEGRCYNCKAHALSTTREPEPVIYCRHCKRIQPKED